MSSQKLAVKLLEVAGHKIDVADNGQIAFEKYRDARRNNTPYAVILMDVSMPVSLCLQNTRSGADAARETGRWWAREHQYDPVIGGGREVFESSNHRPDW